MPITRFLRPQRPATSLPIAALAIGAACFAYGACYEVRAFRLRQASAPVLKQGAAPIRILHISDLHMLPGQRKKQRWVARLADLRPDLVINTGDNLAHPDAVPGVLAALGPLLERPGAFVFGSNDYYAPTMKNPLSYLWRHEVKIEDDQPTLPWDDLQKAFTQAGWADLTNARESVRLLDGRTVELVGVDDPHVERDRYDEVSGPADLMGRDLSVGVVHAPYRRVLDRMTQDGFPLIIAGHTHGGQVCMPFVGTLTTNCDLDRRRAKGLSKYDDSWLHVSAGLGTSPNAPYRFACPPEATLLTLVPRS